MNKILVLVYVPLLDEEYDILIPINQKIGVIKKYIIQAINEILDGNITLNQNAKLYDKTTSTDYQNDIYVRDSGIKNGAKLILI